MLVTGTVLADGCRMERRDIANVPRKTVSRVERVEATHDAVPRHLCDDRRRSDSGAAGVAVDHNTVRWRERPESEAVDETHLRSWRQIGKHIAEPVEVRAMQTMPVDVTGRDDPHRYLCRGVENRSEKRFANLGIDLLRIVQ